MEGSQTTSTVTSGPSMQPQTLKGSEMSFGNAVQEGKVIEIGHRDVQEELPNDAENKFDTDKFASQVFDEALENGEDSALEMLAADDEMPRDLSENEDVDVFDKDELGNTDFKDKDKLPDEIPGIEASVASLQNEINYLKGENRKLTKRVDDIDAMRQSTAEAAAEILEMLKQLIEEEKKKKNEEQGVLMVMLMLMAKMVQTLISDTVETVESTSKGGVQPVEKQAA